MPMDHPVFPALNGEERLSSEEETNADQVRWWCKSCVKYIVRISGQQCCEQHFGMKHGYYILPSFPSA